MTRRAFTQLFLSVFSTVALLGAKAVAYAAEKIEKITKSDDEWKKILTSEQYYILREEGTERPNTSPLNNEKRAGVFLCAGCDLELFLSKFKFDSGTGWPSFYDALP